MRWNRGYKRGDYRIVIGHTFFKKYPRGVKQLVVFLWDIVRRKSLLFTPPTKLATARSP